MIRNFLDFTLQFLFLTIKYHMHVQVLGMTLNCTPVIIMSQNLLVFFSYYSCITDGYIYFLLHLYLALRDSVNVLLDNKETNKQTNIQTRVVGYIAKQWRERLLLDIQYNRNCFSPPDIFLLTCR